MSEVLWDIADGGAGDDDGVPAKFGNLMYIWPTYRPNSISEVKQRWQQIGYSYYSELQRIYYAQKIEQPPAAGSLQFKSSTYTVAETGGSIRNYVSRTGGSYGAASVNYATANGTATAGSDRRGSLRNWR